MAKRYPKTEGKPQLLEEPAVAYGGVSTLERVMVGTMSERDMTPEELFAVVVKDVEAIYEGIVSVHGHEWNGIAGLRSGFRP